MHSTVTTKFFLVEELGQTEKETFDVGICGIRANFHSILANILTAHALPCDMEGNTFCHRALRNQDHVYLRGKFKVTLHHQDLEGLGQSDTFQRMR